MEKRVIKEDAVDDLVLLESIDEDAVMKNLANRFRQDLIYSYIGPVLISVNPFKQVRGLYGKEMIAKYYGKFKFEQAPHVYASAEEAYRQLLRTGKNQCILVSGESGAGKTEAAKKVMEYLTQVSDDRGATKQHVAVKNIKDALLQSNPVLEAFGNATTLRNDNSSRFGKYMVIQMDYSGAPVGGHIQNYLLEKPRVVHQAAGERSFHIFYQLCKGTEVGSAESFDYIKGTTAVKGMDDLANFKQVVEAMKRVGISEEDRDGIFKLVAAILWLGNVRFEKAGLRNREVCKIADAGPAREAATLLCVGESDLCDALTHRTIRARNDSVTSPLPTVDECVKTRDALAKALYSRCFQSLVAKINQKIRTDMCELSFGVLDIYGFEIFGKNSFEQLCINYANEKLQQLFIELTLKAEQEEYKVEGIEWTHIDYFNNKIVCDLIEAKRPAGVFAFLDEECIVPQGDDMKFLKKMDVNLGERNHYYQSLATKIQNRPTEFLIRHYAGDVKYSVEGILDKNKDTLFRDLIELVGSKSRSTFAKALFPEAKTKHDGKKPRTAGTAFVKDMQDLIATLLKCEPHYIRTIKPNDSKRSGAFDQDRVKHQIRYLGIVENIRVRRAGFAFRQDYDYFVKRYKMVSPKTWPRHSEVDPKGDAGQILQELGVPGFELGRSKVFIRDPQSVFTLENKREEMMHRVVKTIQAAYKKYKARLHFLQLREESVRLFQQKKRRCGSWVLYFLGDYINARANRAIKPKLDGELKFADHVRVLDAKNRFVEHALVFTVKKLMLFKKSGKLVRSMKLSDLKQVVLSTYADGHVILNHCNESNKREPSIILETVRKAELATHLARATSVEKVRFMDSNICVVSKKKAMFKTKTVEKSIEFKENPSLHGRSCCFAKTKPSDTKMCIEIPSALGSKASVSLETDLLGRVCQYKGRTSTWEKRFSPSCARPATHSA